MPLYEITGFSLGDAAGEVKLAVVADDPEGALPKAQGAFRRFVDDEIDDYGFLGSLSRWKDDFDARRTELLEAFTTYARGHIRKIDDDNAVVWHVVPVDRPSEDAAILGMNS